MEYPGAEKKRALSFRVEEPVDPVGNHIERSFSLEIFRGKKEYLQRYSSFLGFIGISLYHVL